MPLMILLTILLTMFAQQDEAFVLDDVEFQLPAGWQAYANPGDGYAEIISDTGEYYGSLSLFNILYECGMPQLGPGTPSLSCTPTAANVLTYYIEYLYGYPLTGDEIIETINGVDYLKAYDFYAGIKPVTDGLYAVLIWMPAEDNAGFSQILETITLREMDITFAEPTLIEDGWTLDISSMDVGQVFMLNQGNDVIYVLTDAGILLTVDMDGQIVDVMENRYLAYPLDFAVTLDNVIWVVSYPSLYLLNTEDEAPMINHTPVQAEIGQDGTVYILAIADMTSSEEAYVYVFPPEGEATSFKVGEAGVFEFYPEAFLSNARMSISPQDEIYIFADGTFNIRSFDREGNILNTYEESTRGFGFDADGGVYFVTNEIQARYFLLMSSGGIVTSDGVDVTFTSAE